MHARPATAYMLVVVALSAGTACSPHHRVAPPAPHAALRQSVDALAPDVIVGIRSHRAVSVDAHSGKVRHDFGKASGISVGRHGGVWVIRPLQGRGCGSRLQHLDGGGRPPFVVEPRGDVSATAESPDGTSLAYAVARGSAVDSASSGTPCGDSDLVVRDLRSGRERRWPGGEDVGQIQSLSWSADGKAILVEAVVCCADGWTSRSVSIARPVALSSVSMLRLPDDCVVRFAAYATTLLALDECGEADGHQRVVSLGPAIHGGASVLAFTGSAIGLDAAREGLHLLITMYGTPDRAGKLFRWDGRGTPALVTTGLEHADW